MTPNLDPSALPDFSRGLVPAIAQDAETGEVLMLAYMNEEAFRLTVSTGYAHYWSRSRSSLWKKGETSGHLQEVVEIRLDCDADTVLLRIRQVGAACHTGHRSCFYRKLADGALAEDGMYSGTAACPSRTTDTAGPRAGTLYLIPVPLAGEPLGAALPPALYATVRSVCFFFAENEKSAWRFLSRVRTRESLKDVTLRILDEHTEPDSVPAIFDEIPAGADAAVISEAGTPCVADPGALAVAEAHRRGMRVTSLVGPSSIILALAASGLNGQSFAFRGYLPPDREGRQRAVAGLEAESARTGQTEAFIETPYRTDTLVRDLVANLRPGTRLCIAAGLLGPGERIASMTVADWRARPPEPFGKVPAVFLFLAERQGKAPGGAQAAGTRGAGRHAAGAAAPGRTDSRHGRKSRGRSFSG